MMEPTRDQLADALATAVELFRDDPVTDEERERYRNNEVTIADLAQDIGMDWQVLLVAFTTALAEITGPMGFFPIPTGPSRRVH